MRKDVVRSACVDVDPLAEQRDRHRGAFDVPAGKAWTPRARPHLHSMLARRLPKREIAWMSLPWIDLAPRAGQQLFGARSIHGSDIQAISRFGRRRASIDLAPRAGQQLFGAVS